MRAGSPGLPYRLDELGWLQFDRLCALVLSAEAGLGELRWDGASDTAGVATVKRSVKLDREPPLSLAGPVAIVTIWVPSGTSRRERAAALARRVTALIVDPAAAVLADQILVLTNLESSAAAAALQALASASERQIVALGGDWLCASIDRRADVRAALPSLLGLRDLTALITADARERSSLELAGAQALARVFWPTRAYARARAVLQLHRFVVLTGPPEMGKTAIARMVALAQLTDGWEAHECTGPEQVASAYDAARRQVFIADDAFGSTEYRPDSAQRWAQGLNRLLALLDQDHWLIWTSRPAPLKAALRRLQRERDAARFPALDTVVVDASDLDVREKTLILFRHAKAWRLDDAARELVCANGPEIVAHSHFTPERVRRLVADLADLLGSAELPPGLADALDADQLQVILADLSSALATGARVALSWLIERDLARPTDAMRTSFDALSSEQRDLLVALLDAPAGLIDEPRLRAVIRRHHPGGLSRPAGELIDRLSDHFLRVTPLGIGWVHPSWRDLVIEQLASDGDARRRFLARSGVDGVTLALSLEGGAGGERRLPLLRDDADWDRLGDRLRELASELEPRELDRVLMALASTVTDCVPDSWEERELLALATQLLIATRQRIEDADQIVPAFLVGAWCELCQALPEQLELPDLSATWVELHPSLASVGALDRAELARVAEWLALARVLHDHNRRALARFGFPAREHDLLERLTVTLARSVVSGQGPADFQRGLLEQIGALVPDLAPATLNLTKLGTFVDEVEHRRWWVPHDLPAPPSQEPASAAAPFTSADIARVLNDL